MSKQFAIVGNWGFAPAPKGITIFEYSRENAGLKLIETIRPDIAAGQLYLDSERQTVYAVNECGERRGEIGGGGYVLAFKIDPETGHLTLLNEKETLLPEPSYLCMDKTKQYLVTCHCADPFHVTKVVEHTDGSYSNEVLFDDTALVMFRINEDGSIGDVCDVARTEGGYGKNENCQVNVDPVSGHIQLVEVISRLHSVVPSPSGELLAVCDKGMDKVYTYHIDRENEKLICMDEVSVDARTFPRYSAFHPTLQMLYVNNEFAPTLNCFRYDEKTGKLDRVHSLPVVFKDYGLVEGKPVGAQDIAVHPNGHTLYVSLCGINEIAVLQLDEEGIPTLVQSVSSGGNLPRGICITPDQKYMLVGNMISGDISTFEILADGRLKATGNLYKAVSPSAIRIFTAPESF